MVHCQFCNLTFVVFPKIKKKIIEGSREGGKLQNIKGGN